MNTRTILAGTCLYAVTFTTQASELVISHAEGEFENAVKTEQTAIDLRQSVGNSGLYLYVRGELNDHPVADMDDAAYLGMGYRYQNLAVEIASDEDRYISYAYYTGEVGNFEVRGGLYHGNNHSQGFKQTGLRSSIGYRLNDNYSLGGFYQVGNTTMRSTDDLYGLYLKLDY